MRVEGALGAGPGCALHVEGPDDTPKCIGVPHLIDHISTIPFRQALHDVEIVFQLSGDPEQSMERIQLGLTRSSAPLA